jgi:WD40 repeat protein
MALSSTFFCDTCGAANRVQAVFCCACGRPLQPLDATTSRASSQQTFTGLLAPRHLLKQRYRILLQIGKGGFGAVYKAADTQFGDRLLAIKEMSQSNLNPRELLEATQAFKHEAFLLASLTHPNLPRIYEQFSDAGRWYLVMDYIEGETMEGLLGREGGKLPPEKVLAIGLQLCSVLDYLHNRQPAIIFRDLKPANVMLAAGGHVYLIDFGIARHFKPGQSKDTSALGSSGYAAPEQYGKMQTTPRSDIYTLGATLHQMLSGDDPADTPFHFTPLRWQHQPALTELSALITQMLAIDISKRPASVAEIRQKLQAISAAYTVAQTQPLQATLPAGYRVVGAGVASQAGMLSRSRQASPVRPQKNTLFICSGHTSRVTAIAWSPDGKQLASASYDKTVRLWDGGGSQGGQGGQGGALHTLRRHTNRVNAVAWSPDGKRIASGADDGLVHIWDLATCQVIYTFDRHAGKVTTLAWSPDGARIASASEDNTVQVWEVSGGRPLFMYRDHVLPVNSLAWSPDGRRIASGSIDKTVRIWEPLKNSRSGFFNTLFSLNERPLIYRGHTHKISSVAWSPDGRRIASSGNDKTMQVWDSSNRRLSFLYRHPSSALNAVAWSFDSRYLAAAGNDKTVQVWDAITRNLLSTYLGHSGYVTAVSWSLDRGRIASGGVDRTIQVWRPL